MKIMIYIQLQFIPKIVVSLMLNRLVCFSLFVLTFVESQKKLAGFSALGNARCSSDLNQNSSVGRSSAFVRHAFGIKVLTAL